jgi:hypothetical protein
MVGIQESATVFAASAYHVVSIASFGSMVALIRLHNALDAEYSDRVMLNDDRRVEAVAGHDDEATFMHIQPSGASSRSRNGTAICATLQEPCSVDGEEDRQPSFAHDAR